MDRGHKTNCHSPPGFNSRAVTVPQKELGCKNRQSGSKGIESEYKAGQEVELET